MEKLTQWNENAGKWEPRFCEAAPTHKAMIDALCQKLAVYEEIFPDNEDFTRFFERTCDTCTKFLTCPACPQWGAAVVRDCPEYVKIEGCLR